VLTVQEAVRYKGGLNLDLGKRIHGMRRLRAKYPSGYLDVTADELTIGVTGFARFSLPKSLPLPISLPSGEVEVFRKGPPCPGVGFRTDGRVHYFWTLRPGRIMELCRNMGYKVQ
jgi:hypothetical protein